MDKLKKRLEEVSEKYKEQIEYAEKILGRNLSSYQKQLFILALNLPPGTKIITGRGGRLVFAIPGEINTAENRSEEFRKLCERHSLEPDSLVRLIGTPKDYSIFFDEFACEDFEDKEEKDESD